MLAPLGTALVTTLLAGMVHLPAGSYTPLYRRGAETRVPVAAFALDAEPVTNARWLAFVTAHPEWRRGAVRPLFADRGYLAAWSDALDPGAEALDRPVVGVSWFAARAYCSAQGKRLPTIDEWEYAAAASETRRDASRDPAFLRRVVGLYATRAERAQTPVGRGAPNAYGVRDLHELAWEWTLDFNAELVAADSREAGSAADGKDHGAFCASAAIGAADPANYPAFMRAALRAGLTGRTTLRTLGFRCAADLG